MGNDRNPLRLELRARRNAIPPAQRIASAEHLADRLLALPCLPATGFVSGYWAVDGEIALHVFQMRLPPGLVYCLPVLAPEQYLHFAPWHPGRALTSNRYGIPEPDVEPAALLGPEQMDLVVVPLVGFDARGHRLGMGGGWYDRSFAFRRTRAGARKPPPWLVGAAFAAQQVEALVAERWDIDLDAVCTEHGSFLTPPVASGDYVTSGGGTFDDHTFDDGDA